jgi:hypothetical protein
MNSGRKHFLLCTIAFAVCFCAFDLKNWYYNGAPFVVSEGVLDQVKIYATFPGFIPTYFLLMILDRTLLGASYWLMEIPVVALTSILYGWIFSKTLRWLKQRKNLSQ